MCFSPTSVPDPRCTSKRVRITIPCGKCAACLANKRNDWATRLRMEAKYTESAYFITLTYSDENIPYQDLYTEDGEIVGQTSTLLKTDIQKFMKRLRKDRKEKIRYYVVGEYGEHTKRPHYHMLLFNLKLTGVHLEKYLLEKWNKGRIDIGSVTPSSIMYCTNYIIQKQSYKNSLIQPPFALMSQGLGKQYLEKHMDKHKRDLSRNYIVFEDGQKSRMPRYYRNKIYSKPTQLKQNAKMVEEMEKTLEEKFLELQQKNPSVNVWNYQQDQQIKYQEKQDSSLKKCNKI